MCPCVLDVSSESVNEHQINVEIVFADLSLLDIVVNLYKALLACFREGLNVIDPNALIGGGLRRR